MDNYYNDTRTIQFNYYGGNPVSETMHLPPCIRDDEIDELYNNWVLNLIEGDWEEVQ